MKIQFLGATHTVTGSKYLIEHNRRNVLIDCGLFQGLKELRLRNREPFPVDPKKIDRVILTHAHIDHTGYLPVLMKHGFRGTVYYTPGTRDLCRILLPDSGRLQEEEANYTNRKGFPNYGDRMHDPADPQDQIAEIINRTAARNGVIIVPAFSGGRTQTLLYLLHLLKMEGWIPGIPVYLNSPMSISATGIFCDHLGEHRLNPDQCAGLCNVAKYINSPEESMALNEKDGPMIIISASGAVLKDGLKTLKGN